MKRDDHSSAAPACTQPPLVVHVVDRPEAQGGAADLLGLICHMPPERYRHAVLSVSGLGAGAEVLRGHGMQVIDLGKGGAGRLAALVRMYTVLRALRPALVHTRNFDGLSGQLVAALAGVRLRVHAEYGRERGAGNGRRIRYQLLRRLARPLVGHFIAVSADLERWLIEHVGAAPARVSHICNGVDSVQFHPRLGPAAAVGPPGFMHDSAYVVGSVGRMDEARNHAALVEAFLRLIASPHAAHQRLRLLIVGDGPTRAECQAMLNRAGAAHRAWLPGERGDVAQLMRAMDLFVLPSVAEGTSNAILEAMATGLPVVATSVGANTELVHPGFTGILVPPQSPDLLAAAIADYCRIPEMGARHGARARSQVIARYSLPAMARSYLAVYDALARREETADTASR